MLVEEGEYWEILSNRSEFYVWSRQSSYIYDKYQPSILF